MKKFFLTLAAVAAMVPAFAQEAAETVEESSNFHHVLKTEFPRSSFLKLRAPSRLTTLTRLLRSARTPVVLSLLSSPRLSSV